MLFKQVLMVIITMYLFVTIQEEKNVIFLYINAPRKLFVALIKHI